MSVTRRRHYQCRISDLERRSCSSLFTSAMPKKLAVNPSCIRRSGNTIPGLKPLNSLQENRLRICQSSATTLLPGQDNSSPSALFREDPEVVVSCGLRLSEVGLLEI